MAKVCMKHCHTEQTTGGCEQAETCSHFAGPSTEGSFTSPYQMEPCGSRLPCGVCMITGQICPLAAHPVAVPWWQVFPEQGPIWKYSPQYGPTYTVETSSTVKVTR